MSNFLEMEFFDEQPGNTPFVFHLSVAFLRSDLVVYFFRLRRSTRNMSALLVLTKPYINRSSFKKIKTSQPHTHTHTRAVFLHDGFGGCFELSRL